MNPQSTEKMELGHEPQPGYPTAFIIAVVIASIHLGFILIRSLF